MILLPSILFSFSFSIRLHCGGFRELVLLNVVVRERAAVLELLASEDQALLIRRDALLILDLRLRFDHNFPNS